MPTNADETTDDSTAPQPPENGAELPRVEYHLDEKSARDAVDHLHSLGRHVASGRAEVPKTVQLADALLAEIDSHDPQFFVDGRPLGEWLEAEGIERTAVEPREGSDE